MEYAFHDWKMILFLTIDLEKNKTLLGNELLKVIKLVNFSFFNTPSEIILRQSQVFFQTSNQYWLFTRFYVYIL